MFELIEVEFKNILSYGNKSTIYNFENYNHIALTAKNGSGKCLDENTEIDIEISDPIILDEFIKLKNEHK